MFFILHQPKSIKILNVIKCSINIKAKLLCSVKFGSSKQLYFLKTFLNKENLQSSSMFQVGVFPSVSWYAMNLLKFIFTLSRTHSWSVLYCPLPSFRICKTKRIHCLLMEKFLLLDPLKFTVILDIGVYQDMLPVAWSENSKVFPCAHMELSNYFCKSIYYNTLLPKTRLMAHYLIQKSETYFSFLWLLNMENLAHLT